MSDYSEISEEKFGFKDKESAERTLKILEDKDAQYQKLTVRGLLGRAKRVLSVTKSADKINNINAAIRLFENWLADRGASNSNLNNKTDNNDKVETVAGLGFKDKTAAEKTLKILENRDPEYQKLAIKGLIGSSKRVLSSTKNEEKIKSIKEAVSIFENFLDNFEKNNMMKFNRAYLPHGLIKNLPPPENKLAIEFLQAYGGSKANGNYKHLRTMFPKSEDTYSWDIIRNKHLNALYDDLEKTNGDLFDEKGEITKIHLNMIYWAHSPQINKVKNYIDSFNNSTATKRKSSETESNAKKGKSNN